jgi:hypothetical protein
MEREKKPRATRKKTARAARRAQQELVKKRERLGAAGATVVILGLALVGSNESLLGAIATLVGMTVLMFAVHTYGRLGEES